MLSSGFQFGSLLRCASQATKLAAATRLFIYSPSAWAARGRTGCIPLTRRPWTASLRRLGRGCHQTHFKALFSPDLTRWLFTTEVAGIVPELSNLRAKSNFI